jgi:uncharacterized protein (DUF488 family)
MSIVDEKCNSLYQLQKYVYGLYQYILLLASASAFSSVAGRKRKIEHLWRKFFADPSQWLDNRVTKVLFHIDPFVKFLVGDV